MMASAEGLQRDDEHQRSQGPRLAGALVRLDRTTTEDQSETLVTRLSSTNHRHQLLSALSRRRPRDGRGSRSSLSMIALEPVAELGDADQGDRTGGGRHSVFRLPVDSVG